MGLSRSRLFPFALAEPEGFRDSGRFMPRTPAITATEAPWRAGWRGARRLLWPGLALQAMALTLVMAYYRHAPTREALEAVTAFRARTGFFFGMVSTGLVGGLVPLLYFRSRPATRQRYSARDGAGLVAFWAYKGLEIELFYRLLAHTVGERPDATTIAIKTAIDQFIYCPFFAVPTTVLAYAWIGAHYDARRVLADLRAGSWYRRRVLPVLISNLGVWVPAVCIIYAMPTPLQLPLQNLVLCFFTLLLAHVTETTQQAQA
jgi:hypothetical protein